MGEKSQFQVILTCGATYNVKISQSEIFSISWLSMSEELYYINLIKSSNIKQLTTYTLLIKLVFWIIICKVQAIKLHTYFPLFEQSSNMEKRDKYNENMKQNRRENQETTTAAAITTIRSRNRNKKEEKKLNKPNCYNEIVTTWLEIPIGNRMPLEKLRPSWNVYIFIGQCIQYVHTNSISIPFTVFFSGWSALCMLHQ